MSEPPLNAPVMRLEQMQADIAPFGAAVFGGLFLLMESNVWREWHRLEAAGLLFVLSGMFSTAVCSWLYGKIGRSATEWLRAGVNLGATLGLCWLTHWPLAGWACLILIGGIQGVADAPAARWHSATLALGTVAVAPMMGARLGAAVSAAVAILSAFWLNQRTARIGTTILARLDEKHRDLEVAHAQLRQVHAAAAAQDKLAALGMMAAGIAHEINNPMAYITSNVRALSQDLPSLGQDPEALREYTDDVLPSTLDGIRRVNAIVADLGRFARGNPEGCSEFDVNEQVDHALRITHGQLKNGCCVERNLGDVPKVSGRPQQIVQVLVNLVVNASHAMKGVGTLTVTTRASEKEVLISVRDTGSGIPAEVRRHLFEPFFTTKAVGEGTGLGLSVAHGIVARHGGTIEVESEPELGTCFTIRLPAPSTALGVEG